MSCRIDRQSLWRQNTGLSRDQIRCLRSTLSQLSPIKTRVTEFCSSYNSSENKQPRRRFIISPCFDLLFICGLAPWIFGFLTMSVLGVPAGHPATALHSGLAILYVVCSLLIGEAHQFTSIVRYYAGPRKHKTLRQRLPFWTIYSLLLLSFWSSIVPGGGPLLSFFFLPLVSVAITFFPVVLVQHFCAQARGIGFMYCAMQGYNLSRLEKLHLSVTEWILIITAAFGIASPFGFQPAQEAYDFLWPFALISVLSYACLAISRGLKSNEWMPFGAGLMWMNLAMFVLLPPAQMVFIWLFVPVFFHASQHWAVAWVTKRREQRAENEMPGNSSAIAALLNFCRLVLPVQAICLAVLFLPILQNGLNPHTVTFGMFGADTLDLGWSMLVFYMHYFADRVVWRATS